MDHDTILQVLLGLRHKRQVHLVARHVSQLVRVTPRKVWFFVPDLHLLSAATAAHYRYSFGDNLGTPTRREALLFELCEELRRLRAGARDDPSLFVYQLGDFVDVWRENRVHPAQDMANLLRRALDDNPAADRFLADEAGLGAFLVLGNHDHVGNLSLRSAPRTRRIKVCFALPPAGDVLVTHGDLFDPIEGLPDPWSRWGSRFTTTIGPRTHKLTSARALKKVADVPITHGVSRAHRLLEGARQFATAVRRGTKSKLGRLGLKAARPARVFVIGHTHQAKLAWHRDATVMDCGAWLEQCDLGNGPVPSCQVGVIAQSALGADFRIYQLTPK